MGVAQHPPDTPWPRLGRTFPGAVELRRVQVERQGREVPGTWGNLMAPSHLLCATGMVLCSVLFYHAFLGGMR